MNDGELEKLTGAPEVARELMHRTCDGCAKLHIDGRGRRVCNIHGEQLCNHQACEEYETADGNKAGAALLGALVALVVGAVGAASLLLIAGIVTGRAYI